MSTRTLPVAIGAGITTFLLVAVIGLLAVEFSAIVGLAVGAVAATFERSGRAIVEP